MSTPLTHEPASDSAPLAGVRVIDLTQYEAGPSATQILAWLGADVIKVEPPGGEPARYLMGGDTTRDSIVFVLFNQSKRSVTLDLRSAEGARDLRALLADADVMAENFAPGTLERLGLPIDELLRELPRLIVASVRGYAAGGPVVGVQVARLRRPGGRRRDERQRRARRSTGTPRRHPRRQRHRPAPRRRHARGAAAPDPHRTRRSGRGVAAGRRREPDAQRDGADLSHRPGRRAHRQPRTRPRRRATCSRAGPAGRTTISTCCSPRSSTGKRCCAPSGARTCSTIRASPASRRATRTPTRPARSCTPGPTHTRKSAAMEHLSRFGVPCGAVLDTAELLANPHLARHRHDHRPPPSAVGHAARAGLPDPPGRLRAALQRGTRRGRAHRRGARRARFRPLITGNGRLEPRRASAPVVHVPWWRTSASADAEIGDHGIVLSAAPGSGLLDG